MASGTSGARGIVVILVEEASAAGIALGDAARVGGRVDVDAGSRTLEEVGVLDGPSDDVDLDLAEGEAVVAV